jgi:hypothetical protein
LGKARIALSMLLVSARHGSAARLKRIRIAFLVRVSIVY